jgi:hypothetical protein
MLPSIPGPILLAMKCLVSPCGLLSPKLPGRPHFQRRVRMHFVEVLEGRRQLREHRPRVTQVMRAT